MDCSTLTTSSKSCIACILPKPRLPSVDSLAIVAKTTAFLVPSLDETGLLFRWLPCFLSPAFRNILYVRISGDTTGCTEMHGALFSRPMWIGFLFLAVSFCSTDFRDFMLCGTLSKDHFPTVQSFLVACKGTAS